MKGLPSFLQIATLLIFVPAIIQSCSKQETAQIDNDLLEAVKIVNDYGTENGISELESLTYEEAVDAKQNPQRFQCMDTPVKLNAGPGITSYNFDLNILIGHLLPLYGTEVVFLHPLDTNNDQEIGSGDLIDLLAYYGVPFFWSPDPDEVEYLGLSVSGSGDLSFYSGEEITIEGSNYELLSIFPEFGQNCFRLDILGDEDCTEIFRLQFQPIGYNPGTTCYYYLN